MPCERGYLTDLRCSQGLHSQGIIHSSGADKFSHIPVFIQSPPSEENIKVTALIKAVLDLQCLVADLPPSDKLKLPPPNAPDLHRPLGLSSLPGPPIRSTAAVNHTIKRCLFNIKRCLQCIQKNLGVSINGITEDVSRFIKNLFRHLITLEADEL